MAKKVCRVQSKKKKKLGDVYHNTDEKYGEFGVFSCHYITSRHFSDSLHYIFVTESLQLRAYLCM